jgi:hypothetical protein
MKFRPNRGFSFYCKFILFLVEGHTARAPLS